MTFNDLYDDQYVKYRAGRAGQSQVEWEPWMIGKISVQKDKRGNVSIVTLKDKNWAEASKNDLCDDGILLVEDYYLQIEGLKKN